MKDRLEALSKVVSHLVDDIANEDIVGSTKEKSFKMRYNMQEREFTQIKGSLTVVDLKDREISKLLAETSGKLHDIRQDLAPDVSHDKHKKPSSTK